MSIVFIVLRIMRVRFDCVRIHILHMFLRVRLFLHGESRRRTCFFVRIILHHNSFLPRNCLFLCLPSPSSFFSERRGRAGKFPSKCAPRICPEPRFVAVADSGSLALSQLVGCWFPWTRCNLAMCMHYLCPMSWAVWG